MKLKNNKGKINPTSSSIITNSINNTQSFAIFVAQKE